MSRTSSRPALEKPLERRQADHGRVVADVDVQLRADAPQRFVHVERRPIAAAFVEHVAGNRGEPRSVAGSDDAPTGTSARTRHERHLPVLDRPHAQAVRERRARRIAGKREGALGRREPAGGCDRRAS